MKLIPVLAVAAVLTSLPLLRAADAKSAKAKPYTLDYCLVSDEKFEGSGMTPYETVVDGQTIKFCCKSCLKDFNKETKKYLKKLAEKSEENRQMILASAKWLRSWLERQENDRCREQQLRKHQPAASPPEPARPACELHRACPKSPGICRPRLGSDQHRRSSEPSMLMLRMPSPPR